MAFFGDLRDRLGDMVGEIMGTDGEDTAPAPEPTFDDIRDEIQFSGFTDAQQESILGDLERVYGTDSGRALIDQGLATEGLHYLNTNSQAVLTEFAQATQEDPRFQNSTAAELHGGNFAVTLSAHPRTLSGGRVHVNAYDAIDPATGEPEVYTDPSLAGLSPIAADADPIYSLDHDGEVFEVDPFYILVHETNHAAADERDITGNNTDAGEYYTPSLMGRDTESAVLAYEGLNEANTQVIMEELGIEQLRGSYLGTSLTGATPGENYGLGEDHDIAVTSSGSIDMSNHAAVDAVVVDGITQATLDKFGAPGRTDLLDQGFLLGGGNDTVHGLDGDDVMLLGPGSDRGFGGLGDDGFIAGMGNDTYDGGEANLDPTSDHRSDSATDWGFDTVDYSRLDVPFAPPDLGNGNAVDGVLLSVSADEISVDKGQAMAPLPGNDVDTLNAIDRVVGTDRDDHASVESFADGTVLDGAGGTNDVLDVSTLPDTDTVNLPGAGTFQGQAYDGRIVSDGKTLYYNDYESIVMPELVPSLDAGPKTGLEASNTTGPRVKLPLRDAVSILDDEGDHAMHIHMLRGGGGEALSHALETSFGVSVMSTLADHGVETIPVDAHAMEGDAQNRVGAVLDGSVGTLHEIGKVEEAKERFEAMEAAHEATHPAAHDAEPHVHMPEDEMEAGF